MTIKQACKIAHHCGLETVQEAVLNVELHASQMFLWEEINKELPENVQLAYDGLKIRVEQC